jgi:CHAT domain-containing protein/tetratricopeptide (TPR) repeat protein
MVLHKNRHLLPENAEMPTNKNTDDESLKLCVAFLQKCQGKQYFSDNKDFLYLHPELLSPQLDVFLEEYSKDPHSSALAYGFARMRILLQRCREIGLESAFEEERMKELQSLFIGDGDFTKKQDFVQQHPELMSPQSEAILEASASRQKSVRAQRIFNSVRKLLIRCSEIGVSEAFAEYNKSLAQADPRKTELAKVIRKLLAAETELECRQIIEMHPELVSVEAISLMQQSDDVRLQAKLKSMIRLLDRCREGGIAAAFAKSPEEQAQSEELFGSMIKAVERFLFAKSVRQKESAVRDCPPLGESEALIVLDRFAQDLDKDAALWVQRHRQLLRQCHVKGISAAFARFSQAIEADAPDLVDNRPVGIDDLIRLDFESRENSVRTQSLVSRCSAFITTLDEKAHSREYAVINMMLGQAFARLPSTTCPDHMSKAIDCLQNALRVCSPDEDPVFFANIHMELGRMFSSRTDGDPYVNQIRAINYTKKALSLWEIEGLSDQVAGCLINLGNLHRDLISGTKHLRQEVSLAHYKEALQVLEMAGQDSSTAKVYVGTALLEHEDGNGIENAQRAIRLFEEAKQSLCGSAQYCGLLVNIGAALLKLRSLRGPAADEQAIACYQEALSLCEATTQPTKYARIQRGLATAYRLICPDQCEDRILSHYQEALRYLNLRNDPELYISCLSDLARSHARAKRWAMAHKYYDHVLECVETVFKGRVARPSKKTDIDTYADLFSEAAFVAARFGKLSEALMILERGKTRLLGENLRLHAVRPPEVPDALWQEYLMASYAVRQFDWEESNSLAQYDKLEEAKAEAEQRLETIVMKVKDYDPSFLSRPSLANYQRLLLDNRTAIVAFCITVYGSLGFILANQHRDEPVLIDIPHFTKNDLMELLLSNPDENGFATEGWLGSYSMYLRDPTSLQIWVTIVEPTLRKIGDLLVSSILAKLPEDTAEIVIIPSGGLSLLPLHAVPTSQNDGTLLIERLKIRYAPSLELLMHCTRHSTRTFSNKFCGVIGQGNGELALAEYEVRRVAKNFPDSVLYIGDEANRETVCGEFCRAGYIHFACHSKFDWQEPRRSGIELADGTLTLDELLLSEIVVGCESDGESTKYLCAPLDLSKTRMVTLSSCESGVSEILRGSPDEYIAIASGFMLAGVPSIISTLWAVSDFSAALLMDYFYERLSSGFEAGDALRAASLWLRSVTAGELTQRFREELQQHGTRTNTALYHKISEAWRRLAVMPADERPFAHPYHWAAFTLNGV